MGVVNDQTLELTYYPYFIGSFIIFSLIYNVLSPLLSSRWSETYRSLTQEDKYNWNSRVTSSIHAVVVASLCIYICIFEKGIVAEPVWYNSPVVRAECAILAGYVTADVIMMMLYLKQDRETIMYYCHHLAAALAYFYVMSYGILPFFGNFRILSELSTPCVNNRWFFDQMKVPRTGALFIANGLIMTFLFISSRIFTMPYYWYHVLSLYGTPAHFRLGNRYIILIVTCFALDVLNVMWAKKMILGAMKVLGMTFKNNNTKNVANENTKEKSQ